MTARGRRRAARLAVMALVVAFSGVTLYVQPARRDGTTAPVGALLPATSAVAPAGETPAGSSRREATEVPDAAVADAAPADPAVVAGAEREADPALPAVAEPGDIVVALVPAAAADAVPARVSHVHTSESAQPMGPEPLGGGGAADSGEGAMGPETGARYWFGPQGLVRLFLEARP